jgi:hypothetical protein
MPIFYEWWQKIYGTKASECERCRSKFVEKNYLDKKIWEEEVKVGCHFASLRHLLKHCQNKVYKQNHYVWGMSWIQESHPSLLWQAKDNDITIVNS